MKNRNVIYRYIRRILSLPEEESKIVTYNEIKDGTAFKGYNLWILFFAMLISCIGLNVNSSAAIIGAMLISPLMGPVVGYAYGLAINDRLLKRLGIISWVEMVLVSLFASTLFFVISPFENNTDALQSFTKASIFDIMLAFFGGLAGFLGILKKDGSKVLAGVAVATACIPPLCTAGYGLAHLDWLTFLGGMYFYIINCLFIGLATFLGSRILKFHTKTQAVKTMSPTANWLWISLIILMIIPGTWIAYEKWQQEQDAPSKAGTSFTQQQVDALKLQIDSLSRVVQRQGG